MAGSGAGPSRRSHTKSRKGCKTCKRRHIRCDETFPQCRNCSKHQVICDYQETIGSDSPSQGSPDQSSVAFTPGTESNVEQWQQTGSFPYPGLEVYPPPPTQDYSTTELRLIHHLTTVSNDLLNLGSSNLTIWTLRLPRFLSIASTHPYVMHALLSFSANHLAWTSSSLETRNLHIHHGSIALRGLHEAIGTFSQSNADAILAASLLMLWQATDWRSWSSLRAGVRSVLSAMQGWQQDSLFADLIAEEELVSRSFRMHRRRSSLHSVDRSALLQTILQPLQRLHLFLVGHELELHWVAQLVDYIQRLQSAAPAQSPEEQFNHLYTLRKWLMWVPIALLRRQEGKGPAMLVLAHFYATALSLEPLFPDLGATFCAALALPPLEAIIGVTSSMQLEQWNNNASSDIQVMMQFPQQAVYSYRARAAQYQIPQSFEQDASSFTMYTDATSYGNLSPAFAPATLNYAVPPSTLADAQNAQNAQPSASFLEVPALPSQILPTHTGFGYGTSSWGAMPSPGFPPLAYTTGEGQMYNMSNLSLGSLPGGTPNPEAEPSDQQFRQY